MPERTYRDARSGRRRAGLLLAALSMLATSCARTSEAEPIALVMDDLTVVAGDDGETSVIGNVTGPVARLTIEWGDGAVDSVVSGFPGVRVSHAYDDDGSYSVIVAAEDADGATTNRVLTADVVGASPTTTTTTTTSTTTTVPPTTTTTTTTTVPPTTTTTSTTTTTTTTTTTVAPTTTTTTTTTLPPQPITFDITTPTGGGGRVEGKTQLPFRVNVASWWNSGNLHARAAVGVMATAQAPWAESWLYHDFTAQRDRATVRYTVSWDGIITVLASAGSAAGVSIAVSVYEVDGSTQGARLAREVLLDERLDSETIKFVTTLDYEDSVTSSMTFPVTAGKQYRVRLDLRCEARAALALGATECTFGSNDVADTGKYARWRDVTVTLENDG